MKMNGDQQRRVFSAGIPPKLVQIWKYVARVNFKAFTTREKKHGEPSPPPSSDNKGGTDTFIEWESTEALEKWEKSLSWLPFPQNQTNSGNIQPRLTSRHSLQEKRHRYPTHFPLFQSGD